MTMPYMIIAFQKFNYRKMFGSDWVGFANFKFFFSSTNAGSVTFNTLYINGLHIIFGTLFAVTLAIALNEITRKRFLKITQSTMIFPYFLSWITVSYILYSLLATEEGLINHLLISFGMEPVRWYSKANLWPAIIVIMRIWKGAGMNSIIYLAALTGIDESLYEAAYVDGATRWQRIAYITLPLLLPTVFILTLMEIGRIFTVDFGMMYALVGDNGQLLPTTDVIDTYVYRALRITGNPSNAMAVGLYQSVVGLVLVWGSNRLVKRFFPEGGLF
jgi:putative aldouronate transport system permease protein